MKKIILALFLTTNMAQAGEVIQLFANSAAKTALAPISAEPIQLAFAKRLTAAKKADSYIFERWYDHGPIQGFAKYNGDTQFSLAQKVKSPSGETTYVDVESPFFESRVSNLNYLKADQNHPAEVGFTANLGVERQNWIRARYQVERIEGRDTRVQNYSWLISDHFETQITREGTHLRIERGPENTLEAHPSRTFQADQLVKGQILGWEVSSDGQSLRIYSLDNGNISQNNFDFVSLENGIDLQKRGSFVLPRGDVARLGFYKVRLVSTADRQQTHQAGRGMIVEMSANTGIGN